MYFNILCGLTCQFPDHILTSHGVTFRERFMIFHVPLIECWLLLICVFCPSVYITVRQSLSWFIAIRDSLSVYIFGPFAALCCALYMMCRRDLTSGVTLLLANLISLRKIEKIISFLAPQAPFLFYRSGTIGEKIIFVHKTPPFFRHLRCQKVAKPPGVTSFLASLLDNH